MHGILSWNVSGIDSLNLLSHMLPATHVPIAINKHFMENKWFFFETLILFVDTIIEGKR